MLGHAMFFMWPRVLDDWLEDRPGHKWWQEGGSTFFYRYILATEQTNDQQRKYSASPDFFLEWLELGSLEIGNFQILFIGSSCHSTTRVSSNLMLPTMIR